MSQITEQQLVQIIVGIAKTHAAVISAVRGQDITLLASIQSRVGAIAGHGRASKPEISFENLSAHLLLRALSTPGPNAQTIDQFASQEVGKLIHKSAAP